MTKRNASDGNSLHSWLRNDQGHVVDFHSLRMTFITNLTRSCVAPKIAQMLSRHSDINLTMNTYTMLGVMDQAAASEALPPIPTSNAVEPAHNHPTAGHDGHRGAAESRQIPWILST